MVLAHPPSNISKQDIFTFPIGRVMKFITERMLLMGIEFEEKHGVYVNDIIHMGGKYHDDDVYKLCFYPLSTLSEQQARNITEMFCCHDEYDNTDIHNDVIAPKEWVDYLTFQLPINKTSIPYEDGVMGGRIIVQFRLYGAFMLILDDKINNILC